MTDLATRACKTKDCIGQQTYQCYGNLEDFHEPGLDVLEPVWVCSLGVEREQELACSLGGQRGQVLRKDRTASLRLGCEGSLGKFQCHSQQFWAASEASWKC